MKTFNNPLSLVLLFFISCSAALKPRYRFNESDLIHVDFEDKLQRQRSLVSKELKLALKSLINDIEKAKIQEVSSKDIESSKIVSVDAVAPKFQIKNELQSAFETKDFLKKVQLKSESSPNYKNITDFLETVSMNGELDFSSAEPYAIQEPLKKLIKIESDNLIPGVTGALWNVMTTEKFIKNHDSGVNTFIREALEKKAPKTFAFSLELLPKKIYEAEVLEGWLVDGLKILYPTLNRQVRKHDAIALILLAVTCRAYLAPEQYENISEFMEQLIKYNGNDFTVLPLDLFKVPSEMRAARFQKQQFDKLVDVINKADSDLKISKFVASQIQI